VVSKLVETAVVAVAQAVQWQWGSERECVSFRQRRIARHGRAIKQVSEGRA
jgi:hypothetical protein